MATAWRAPARISRKGCSSAGRGCPKSRSHASEPIPMTQESWPSTSRNPTARTSAARSPQSERTAARLLAAGVHRHHQEDRRARQRRGHRLGLGRCRGSSGRRPALHQAVRSRHPPRFPWFPAARPPAIMVSGADRVKRHRAGQDPVRPVAVGGREEGLGRQPSSPAPAGQPCAAGRGSALTLVSAIP